jgi:hypothetical protein
VLLLCCGCDVVSPPPAPYYDYSGSGSRYSTQGRSYPQGSNPNSGYYDPRTDPRATGTGNRPYYPGTGDTTAGGTSTTGSTTDTRRDPLTDLDPNSVNPDPGTSGNRPSTSGTTGTPGTTGSPGTTGNTSSASPSSTAYPFGAPVPGKEGHVYSPYATDKVVDVRDIPRGTKVYCPFTNKIFLVP